MMHKQAREAAMPVECKKDSLKQLQSGDWKLSLTLALDGLPEAIMKAAPGTRYQCAFVEVGDNEEPIQHTPPERPKTPFHEKPYSVQAGIRCSDERFQKYVSVKFPDGAANYVREWCGVDSRSELDDEANDGARLNWWNLNAAFEKWAGMVPEER